MPWKASCPDLFPLSSLLPIQSSARQKELLLIWGTWSILPKALCLLCSFPASSSCCLCHRLLLLCHSDECQGEAPHSAVNSQEWMSSIIPAAFSQRNSPVSTPYRIDSWCYFLLLFDCSYLCLRPLKIYWAKLFYSMVLSSFHASKRCHAGKCFYSYMIKYIQYCTFESC